MVLGRLVHYTVDAVLLSTVVAGIRRSSGFSPEMTMIPNDTLRYYAERYFAIGETIFDVATATAVNSQYFSRGAKK